MRQTDHDAGKADAEHDHDDYAQPAVHRSAFRVFAGVFTAVTAALVKSFPNLFML